MGLVNRLKPALLIFLPPNKDMFVPAPAPAPPTAVARRSYLFRQLSRRSKLYTEMYVDSTILHQQDNLYNFLSNRPEDGPLAVQVLLPSCTLATEQCLVLTNAGRASLHTLFLVPLGLQP